MARLPQAWEQQLKCVHLFQWSERKDNYSVSPGSNMKTKKAATQELDMPSTIDVAWTPLAPLVELRALLRGLGIVPYAFDNTLKLYVLRWRSVAAIMTVITATYFTIASVVGTVGVLMTISYQPIFHSTQQGANLIWQMMVVVLFGNMLLNAWSQTVSLLLAGNRLCHLLNSWLSMTHWSDVSSVKLRVRLQVVFLMGSSVSILSLVLSGFPDVMLEGLDGVASILFLVPTAWLELSPFLTQVISFSYLFTHTRHYVCSIVVLVKVFLFEAKDQFHSLNSTCVNTTLDCGLDCNLSLFQPLLKNN